MIRLLGPCDFNGFVDDRLGFERDSPSPLKVIRLLGPCDCNGFVDDVLNIDRLWPVIVWLWFETAVVSEHIYISIRCIFIDDKHVNMPWVLLFIGSKRVLSFALSVLPVDMLRVKSLC